MLPDFRLENVAWISIFRQEMKTKRGLQNVLVTPFGLTKSKHNGIINNVLTAEGLFRAEE